MQYDTGSHCVFYHRYHIVWSTKYRYKVLTGDMPNELRRPAGYGTSITLIFMGFAFAAFACFLVFLFGLGIASV